MRVIVKESTIVRPSENTPKQALPCTNLDLSKRRLHYQVVHFYKKPTTSSDDSANFFDPIMLKDALSSVLVPFYPLAGRLGNDENGRFQINCNEEGVLFVVAETESFIDEFGDFTPSIEFQTLIPTVDGNSPLLLLQITFFNCGGVSLGVGLHHTLVDGISGFHFLNSWSNVARGLSITVQPYFDRTLLSSRDPPNSTYHHTEFEPSPSMNTLSENPECQSDPKPTSTFTLKITLDQIANLQAKVKTQTEAHNEQEENLVRYSTYETLAAHVWRCTCIARGLADDQATKLYTVADGRSRLQPPFPPGYFGNVIFTTTVEAMAGDLVSRPLLYTVQKIHDAVASRDDDYLRSSLDFLELLHDPTVVAMAKGPHTNKCPNLNLLSWKSLPMYDSDFGWGRPIYVGPATVAIDGLGYMLPSPTKDGGLLISICLETHHMQVFRKVFYDYL